MAQHHNAAVPASIMAAMSCMLVLLALPQLRTAWLTAPIGLDHTQHATLDTTARANYKTALNILPQSETFYALAESQLRDPNITAQEREHAIDLLKQAAARTPGNTHVWYLLAAALEPQINDPDQRELWDHALSMSLLTGPFARDLAAGRAVLITQHWETASPELKNLWQEQMINLWGADPDSVHNLYMALPPASQHILVDTLDEVPEDEPQN